MAKKPRLKKSGKKPKPMLPLMDKDEFQEFLLKEQVAEAKKYKDASPTQTVSE